MNRIINIEEFKNQGGIAESQHKDLEMYKKLGVLGVFKIEGKDDEDCELKWLRAITDKDSDQVYMSEPGNV